MNICSVLTSGPPSQPPSPLPLCASPLFQPLFALPAHPAFLPAGHPVCQVDHLHAAALLPPPPLSPCMCPHFVASNPLAFNPLASIPFPPPLQGITSVNLTFLVSQSSSPPSPLPPPNLPPPSIASLASALLPPLQSILSVNWNFFALQFSFPPLPFSTSRFPFFTASTPPASPLPTFLQGILGVNLTFLALQPSSPPSPRLHILPRLLLSHSLPPLYPTRPLQGIPGLNWDFFALQFSSYSHYSPPPLLLLHCLHPDLLAGHSGCQLELLCAAVLLLGGHALHLWRWHRSPLLHGSIRTQVCGAQLGFMGAFTPSAARVHGSIRTQVRGPELAV